MFESREVDRKRRMNKWENGNGEGGVIEKLPTVTTTGKNRGNLTY